MNAMRPLDDAHDLLLDDLPRMRARPEEDDGWREITEPADSHDAEAPVWPDDKEPVADFDDAATDNIAGTTIGTRPASRILAAIMIMAGLAAGGAYLLQPDTLPIRQVRVEGEFRHLSQTELQATVLEHMRGGFFSVNVAGVHDAVRANPWVREVSVQRVWPDALQVTVREQVPMARWGDKGLVGTNGEYFAPDAVHLPDGLPLLIGPEGAQETMIDKLQLAQKRLASLELQVERLELSERRAWSFTTGTGLEVVLGREDFEQRLQRFIDLVPRSLGERLGEAAYVDMRYTNGFAVRFNYTGDAPAKREGAA